MKKEEAFASCGVSFLLVLGVCLSVAHAFARYSISIYGRYSTWTIKVHIPSHLRWAYDVVLNAIVAWGKAETGYWQSSNRTPLYSFMEVNDAAAIPTRTNGVPEFSLLDLYAVHVRVMGDAPAFVTLPGNLQNPFTPAAYFHP